MMRQLLRNKLFKHQIILRKWAQISKGQPSRIEGYRRYLKGQPRGRALLSYLVEPVVEDLKGRKSLNFSNVGLGVAWARVLNQLGLTVDIINWDDREWQPKHRYDLVIAHGGKNTPSILKTKQLGGQLIYFATGSYWKWHNQQGEKRAELFLTRHHHRIQPDRQVPDSEDAICQAADAIFCLGTEAVKKTYRPFASVTNFEIAAFPDSYFSKSKKDYQVARDNFLFFAGGGNLHKGLDVLLDSFAGLNQQHLYICTSLNDDFKKYYANILKRPNIHFEDVVELKSRHFYDLIDRCAFVILPSAAEGSPGSVADCMIQGLLPVVTPAAGVWTGDCGFEINQLSPREIRQQIRQLSALTEQNLEQRARCIFDHASTEQSPANFEASLQKALRAYI